MSLLFPDHLGSVENSRGSHGRRADDSREADAEEPGRDSEAAETNIKIQLQLPEVIEQGLSDKYQQMFFQKIINVFMLCIDQQ